MKNLIKDIVNGFRNESVTVMFSATEKGDFISECERKGVKHSEEGRRRIKAEPELRRRVLELEKELAKAMEDKKFYEQLSMKWLLLVGRIRRKAKSYPAVISESGHKKPFKK